MSWTRSLDEIDETQADVVGGKAANLGELRRIDGVRVPDGFCVTTAAFELIMVEAAPEADAVLDQLSRVQAHDGDAIRTLSAEIRRVITEVSVGDDLVRSISTSLAALGEEAAYAVRSSATAEDLPDASFAGQQDSYLDVVGLPAILEHVRRCWASLFTERAVTYRLRNGVDHRRVRMAVVVQQMIFADVAGVLFTADPVTGNRTVAAVEAVPGLGEALVSGLVDPDGWTVRGDKIVTRTLTGTQPLLTDAQVLRLVQLGRRIEAHLGRPQDIEWCLVGEDFFVVQSRPITTLFPVPARADQESHVYLSVGHQQMMTDPMRPLGLSVWQLTARRPMAEAGGRLFVDITAALASPGSRDGLLDVIGRSDPLMRDALQTVLDRDDIVPVPQPPGPASPPAAGAPAALEADPALVTDLVERAEASLAVLRRDIADLSGPALLDFVRGDVVELRRILFDPQGHQVLMSAIESAEWLNEQLERWLGEKNAADTLARSVPRNVTSEMGLALLDVADAVRPHPAVVAFLRRVEAGGVVDEHVLDELAEVPGGLEARDAIEGWLERYGMRGVGEIDITRPRWSERPSMLVPVILGHVRNVEPGAAAQRFEQGRREAWAKERELLERVRDLPDGQRKAAEVEQRIGLLRTFMGYREYPKYGMVSRYLVYKRALLEEAERLVRAGVLREQEDIFFLRFDELHDVVRTHQVDEALIERRKDAFRSYSALAPPRVLTSDGETVTGAYRRDDLPPGALAGLAVSAGIVEGRARVVLDAAHADLEPGDILVTAYTDPSWTALFVAVAGLVTEVGGRMTHGAVIAREYGLPAVVGVQRATQVIRDGQRIRLHGTAGYVELLP